MEKITKVYDVYTFDESDEEIQQKILKKQIEIERDLWCEFYLYEEMEETAKNLLKTYFDGAKITNIFYDLNATQGSGAQINFEISIFDLNKKYNFLSEKTIKFLETTGFKDFTIKQNGRYYHERAFAIDWYDLDDFSYYDYFLTDEEMKKENEKLEKIMIQFENEVVDMNKELKEEGYSFINDVQTFKEMAVEYLNGERFLKNGEIFTE